MARPWRTRRFFRVLYESPVIIRINRTHKKQVRLAQKNLAGKMLDLSEGGCGIESSFFMPKGTKINVFLDRALLAVKDENAAADKAVTGHSRLTAEVISYAVKGPRKYRIGLRFVRVSMLDRQLIVKFIKFHERRKDPRIEF